ncbi:MAG: lysoplasmalogenase [Micropepsaceae bacterium]
MIEQLLLRGDGLDGLRIALASISLSASVAYMVFVSGGFSPSRAVLKTVVFAVLALLPLTYLPALPTQTYGLVLLAAALGLSSLGDLFLALENERKYFTLGLASFLLGHVAYLLAFLPEAHVPGVAVVVLIALLVGAAGFLLRTLWPHLGKLRLPVLAYFTVIMSMVGVSLCVTSATWMLGAGAVSFAVSDSLIAVRKFLRPFHGIDGAVWVTYVVAQFLLCFAILDFTLNR